jgi:hypothetical protein
MLRTRVTRHNIPEDDTLVIAVTTSNLTNKINVLEL